MEVSPSPKPDVDEQLEITRWLIVRIDSLRSSTSSRAALIVSSNAVFLTASAFLLDKFLSLKEQYSLLQKTLFLVGLLPGIVLFILSIISATNAIAIVWKSSKEVLRGETLPNFLFFRPGDTEKVLPEYSDFKSEFLSSTKEQMLSYALGELYIASRVHNRRYKFFRRAIQLLTIAVFSFLLSISVLFFGSF